jgi:hypothetical protein
MSRQARGLVGGCLCGRRTATEIKMKKFPIAAAALLFGTSAFAMVPSTEPTGVTVDKDPYVVTGAAATDAVKLQPAAVDWWGTAEPVAYTPAAYSNDDVKAAEFTAEGGLTDTVDKSGVDKSDAALEGDADIAAESDPALEAAVADVEPVSYETSAVDDAKAPIESGVGGPDAGIAMAAADMAPRPAAQNYPACRPGRGDDNCIQLYEPGVRQQLASWDQPTGGFAGAGETQVAMGGPYEPADSATETERLNQQALADSASALQGAQMADAAAIPTDEQMLDDDSPVESASLDEGDFARDDEEPVEA